MKKNILKQSIVGLSGLVLLSMTANSVSAATEGTVNYKEGSTTAWTSPEAGQKVDSYLAKDQKVSIASEKQVFGDKWYKLDNGTWVAAKYITTKGSAAKETTTATPSTNNITVNYSAGAVTLWSDANSGVATGKYVFNGDKLAVKSTKTVYGSTWYQVDGGWISGEFVSTNGQAAQTTASTGVAAAQPAQQQTTTQQAAPSQQVSRPAAAAPSSNVNASGLVGRALSQVGKPYAWGAAGPSAFDCSGLVYWASGYTMPRTSQAQSSMGTMVSLNALQPGDLIFWGGRGSAWHVGVYIGNGSYVHAPAPGQNVKVQQISSYFMPSFGVRL